MPEDYDTTNNYYAALPLKLRDLEEKQRTLKDRLILIGDNLVDLKEKTTHDLLELKKQIEEIKRTLERLQSFLKTASKELSTFAKKEDLEILAKQAKMFQPLELVRFSDLEKLKKRKGVK